MATITESGGALIFGQDITVNGAFSAQGAVTVGQDDTGYDVQLYGATSGVYALWDESADALVMPGAGLVVGHTAKVSHVESATPLAQVLGTGTADSSVVVARYSADGSGPIVSLGKSRHSSLGSLTYVQSGDILGELRFLGASELTSQMKVGARIAAVAATTWSASTGGAHLDFSLDADNNDPGNYARRLRLDADGNLIMGTGGAAGSSAAGVLVVPNGTQGGALANAIQLVSEDLSAGNTIPSIRTEGSGIISAGTPGTAEGTIAIKVNGTVYYIPYDTSPAS